MNRKLPKGEMYVVNFDNELHLIAESPEQAKELARLYFLELLTTNDKFTKDFKMKARVREADYVEKWTEDIKKKIAEESQVQ
jgi:hypothetical protein